MSSPAGGISQGNEGSPRCLVEAETTSDDVCSHVWMWGGGEGGGGKAILSQICNIKKTKDKKEDLKKGR